MMRNTARSVGLAVVLALIAVVLPASGARAAEVLATTFSVISDNGPTDTSTADGEFFRNGPDQVTASAPYEGEIRVDVSSGDWIWILHPRNGQLAEGTYTDVPADYPTDDKPAFILNSSPCYRQGTTTFTISDLAADLSHFVLRFHSLCPNGTSGKFGEVRINEPTDSDLVLSTTHLTWPARYVQLARSRVPVTLSNPGSDPIAVTGIALDGADADQFLVGPVGPCAQVVAGATCNVTVGYRPTRAGAPQADLVVTTTGGTHRVALTGNGVLGSGTVMVAGDWMNGRVYPPGAFWQGHDNVGWSQSGTQLQVSAAAKDAAPGDRLDMTFQSAPGDQLHVGHYVIHDPFTLATRPGPTTAAQPFMSIGTSRGSETQYGEFDIHDLAADRLWVTFYASGGDENGPGIFGEVRFGEPVTGDVLTIPTRMQWTPQAVGETNDPIPLTLVNLGAADLKVTDARPGGTNAADLTVGPVGGCAVISPGAGCALNVTFQPTAVGARSAAVAITDSRGGHTFDLSGTAKPGPQLATTPPGPNTHFPTCNYQGTAAGPNSMKFSWADECDPHQGYFPDYQAHFLIRGSFGSNNPAKAEADGFPVYSGHGHSALVQHLDPSRAYTFTLFTQHPGSGETVESLSVVPIVLTLSAYLTHPLSGPSPLTLTGALTAGDSHFYNETIQLRALYPGATAPVVIGQTKTSTSGDFFYQFTPTRAATYSAYFSGVLARGGATFPATSPSRSIPLVSKVVLKTPKSTATYKKATTFTATLTPTQQGYPAQFQVYRKGKWKSLAVAYCSAKGGFSFRVKLTDKGTNKYRVWWMGDDIYAGAASKTVKIKVK